MITLLIFGLWELLYISFAQEILNTKINQEMLPLYVKLKVPNKYIELPDEYKILEPLMNAMLQENSA